MEAVKKVVMAFLVGGILGVISQLFYVMWTAILGPDNLFLIVLTLITMGIVGAVLFIAGFYQKLEEVSGFGAFLNFSGLATAASGAVVRTKYATGSTAKAVAAGAKLIGLIIGLGFLFSFIIAVIQIFIMA